MVTGKLPSLYLESSYISVQFTLLGWKLIRIVPTVCVCREYVLCNFSVKEKYLLSLCGTNVVITWTCLPSLTDELLTEQCFNSHGFDSQTNNVWHLSMVLYLKLWCYHWNQQRSTCLEITTHCRCFFYTGITPCHKFSPQEVDDFNALVLQFAMVSTHKRNW